MPLPRLAHYELLFPIARGGMATVYLGQSRGARGFERRVAIKVMHPHLLAEGAEAARELLEEAELAGKIRHPNVVPVLDVGEGEDGVFLVMEYVEGETLSGLLRSAVARREPLSLPVALRLLSDALAGLHAAHELLDEHGAPVGIVHRDFSPQNLLIGIDGTTRLTDFGIAKARQRAGATETGLVKGKTGYMSPEQIRGQELDRRSDVWAAGVVAWEVLACRRLFNPDTGPEGVLERVARRELPIVSSVRPEVPEAVARAIAGALEPDLASRCPDVETLRRALLEGFSKAPADPLEVGRLVRDVAGQKLTEREERLRSARAALTPSEPEGATESSAALPARPHPSARKGAFAALVVALGVGISVGVAKLRSEPAPVAATPEPSAAPPAASSVSLAPAPAPLLTVRADAPIARISIGERIIALDPPRKSVEIERTTDEVTERIELSSADGRKKRIEPGSAREIDVRFAAERPAAVRPRARTAPKPDILPSPYPR